MLFSSLEFLVFLPAVWGLYRVTPRRWHRGLLLVASYVFYMSWGPIYGLLLALVSLLNWGGARLIAAGWRPRTVLALAVSADLGVLAFYKYVGFFAANLRLVLEGLGLDPAVVSGRWEVVLPLGISFFTFQGVSYVVDVYRDPAQVVRSPLDLLLFNAWFPQLIAGPIVRASELVYQFERLEAPRWAGLQSGALLAMRGFFKKAVLADNLSLVVDQAFSTSGQWDATSAWLYMGAYALQIYFDFSGYSEIAIGISRCFGIELPENFRNPYASASITEFWRRWHMTLSSWLRDYLYIPLGGNRQGRWRQYRNLMLTMLFGGLWHGASWNFVIWGGFHGGLLAVHKLYRERCPRGLRAALDGSWLWRGLAVGLTFGLVLLSWVPFRAQGFAQTAEILEALFTGGFGAVPRAVYGSTALVVVSVYGGYRLGRLALGRSVAATRLLAWAEARPALAAAALVHMGWLVFALSPSGASPFIYFQF